MGRSNDASALAPGRETLPAGGQEGGLMVGVILALATCGVVLFGAWHVRRAWRLRAREMAWRPRALRNASIEYAEKTFFTDRPFRLVAKIDRAYQSREFGLVLTELKRRRKARVYLSDLVELSAQKVAIERSTRRRVADFAYVVVENPATDARTPIGVKLLSEQHVASLARRHLELMEGRTSPRKANLPGLCSSCAYVDRCGPDVLGPR
jgi:CRISPR-associated exonuclease Cas4